MESAKTDPHRITALLVMASEARGVLQGHLEEAGVEVLAAANCREARRLLRSSPAIHIAIVSPTLADGSWWTIRQELLELHRSARIIVCLAESDGGVTDLLERGADDVLVAPFKRDAVKRIFKAASAAREPDAAAVLGFSCVLWPARTFPSHAFWLAARYGGFASFHCGATFCVRLRHRLTVP